MSTEKLGTNNEDYRLPEDGPTLEGTQEAIDKILCAKADTMSEILDLKTKIKSLGETKNEDEKNDLNKLCDELEVAESNFAELDRVLLAYKEVEQTLLDENNS